MDPRTPLLALILATPLTAQSEAKAVGAFRRVFSGREKTVNVLPRKTDALAALAAHDSGKVAKALVTGFLSLEAEAEPLRQKRRAALMRGGGSKALHPLRVQLQPIRNLQDRVRKRIEGLRSEDALRALATRLVGSTAKLPLMLQIAIASRAAEFPTDSLDALVAATGARKKKSKDKRARFALPLLAALRHAGRRAAKAAPWVVEQLEQPFVEVRIEAARTLATLCWPGSVRPLIAQAKREDGRVLDAMFDALIALTGQNPGRSASAWERWCEAEGGPYVSGEIRLGGKQPPRQKQTQKNGTGSYFGIPQDGNSILYVFDNSQSMKQPLQRRAKKAKGEKKTRMDRCREELHRALDQLTPQKKFNLLAFANKLRMFAPTMQQATKANIAKAHQWIDGLKLEFQTNIHDALELSFFIAGRGAADRYYALEADTLFFLSDGAPTAPKPTGRGIQRDNIPEILAAVRRFNPLKRMVIHTIGLGVRRGRARARARQNRGTEVRQFMQKLAAQNGGKFVIPD